MCVRSTDSTTTATLATSTYGISSLICILSSDTKEADASTLSHLRLILHFPLHQRTIDRSPFGFPSLQIAPAGHQPPHIQHHRHPRRDVRRAGERVGQRGSGGGVRAWSATQRGVGERLVRFRRHPGHRRFRGGAAGDEQAHGATGGDEVHVAAPKKTEAEGARRHLLRDRTLGGQGLTRSIVSGSSTHDPGA